MAELAFECALALGFDLFAELGRGFGFLVDGKDPLERFGRVAGFNRGEVFGGDFFRAGAAGIYKTSSSGWVLRSCQLMVASVSIHRQERDLVGTGCG